MSQPEPTPATNPRVAVVTGAARGIGAATVRALADDGWSVLAIDRATDDPRLPYPMGTVDELHAVVDQASAGPGTALAHIADACDPGAMVAAVSLAEKRFGGLDAMVAVAGVMAGGVPMWEMAEVELKAVVEVNLMGSIVAARTGIPAMLRRPPPRQGRFLAVASAAATRGMPHLAAYGAAKAGVAGLIRGLAADLRGTGITANAISPGSTDTPLLKESARLYRLASSEAFAEQQPIERLLTPEEVAASLVWLASEAYGGITGAVLPVDGGLSL